MVDYLVADLADAHLVDGFQADCTKGGLTGGCCKRVVSMVEYCRRVALMVDCCRMVVSMDVMTLNFGRRHLLDHLRRLGLLPHHHLSVP
ncbi:MAG TPA: hypothetical protein VHV83_15930 [Armatimonadota bacterium]|nr:hypothetical protein [Armatimonadota bacterium]